jgi:formate hydrogenlyase subunit 6/NADH:ubiquinone oxidoreductase subunit I
MILSKKLFKNSNPVQMYLRAFFYGVKFFFFKYRLKLGIKAYVSNSWRAPYLVIDSESNTACDGCGKCVEICPTNCITIEASKKLSSDLKQIPNSFAIDYSRCMFCSLCQQVCHVDAIEYRQMEPVTELNLKIK